MDSLCVSTNTKSFFMYGRFTVDPRLWPQSKFGYAVKETAGCLAILCPAFPQSDITKPRFSNNLVKFLHVVFALLVMSPSSPNKASKSFMRDTTHGV